MSKTDIQIAREAKMKPINEVLEKINVPDDATSFSPMGRHIAKLNLETNEIVGKDLSINFNKKYFNEDNDPRLKAKSIIIEKENSFFKKGIFTTCKKRGTLDSFSRRDTP